MRSIEGSALDCSVLNREVCIRLQITAPISQGTACDDLGQRGDLRYTWMRSISTHALDRCALDPGPHARSPMRSIVSLCSRSHRQGLLASFSPFQHFDAKDLQHNKTLKQAKTLEINNAMSLTIIS